MDSAKVQSRQSRLSEAMADVLAEGNRWHVIPARGRWTVLREGAGRATGTFIQRQDAVERAVDLASRSGGEVIVHRKDASIAERLTATPRSKR